MANELAQTDGEGDDLILSPMAEAFCRNYGDPESPFYSHGTAAAEAAGFKQPHSAQWKLRRRSGVIQRLEQFQDAARAAEGRVLSDLEHVRCMALKDGSAAALAVAARCSELAGKHLAMWADRAIFAVDREAAKEWDEKTAAEAHRLARLLIEQDGDRILGLPVPGESAALGALPDVEGKSNPGQKENEQ
jgi:hypothetical protein